MWGYQSEVYHHGNHYIIDSEVRRRVERAVTMARLDLLHDLDSEPDSFREKVLALLGEELEQQKREAERIKESRDSAREELREILQDLEPARLASLLLDNKAERQKMFWFGVSTVSVPLLLFLLIG